MDKAVWDHQSVGIFLAACHEQIVLKRRRGRQFTKLGWDAIVATFNEKTGKNYDKKQLKNKYDLLRKEIRDWFQLKAETGVGWDPVRNTITATDEWWTRKIQVTKNYGKFREHGIMFENELTIIFKENLHDGVDEMCPELAEDLYRPPVNADGDEDMNLEEGSGDSEDERFGGNKGISTGVTDEMASIGITTSSGKRKRGERGDGASSSKKKKIPASRQIADAISAIADATTAKTNKFNETSMDAILGELDNIEEVKGDLQFHAKCIMVLQRPIARDTFKSLKQNRPLLLTWLRGEVDRL